MYCLHYSLHVPCCPGCERHMPRHHTGGGEVDNWVTPLLVLVYIWIVYGYISTLVFVSVQLSAALLGGLAFQVRSPM